MKIIIISAFALLMTPLAYAEDNKPQVDPVPVSYEQNAENYLNSRISDSRTARFKFSGKPYRVKADIQGHKDLDCWALDVKVKTRLPNNSWSRYMDYTVIFYEGRPVALESDVSKVSEV